MWSKAHSLLSTTLRQQHALLVSDPLASWHGNPALHLNHEQPKQSLTLQMGLRTAVKAEVTTALPNLIFFNAFLKYLLFWGSPELYNKVIKAEKFKWKRSVRPEGDIETVKRPFWLNPLFPLKQENKLTFKEKEFMLYASKLPVSVCGHVMNSVRIPLDSIFIYIAPVHSSSCLKALTTLLHLRWFLTLFLSRGCVSSDLIVVIMGWGVI